MVTFHKIKTNERIAFQKDLRFIQVSEFESGDIFIQVSKFESGDIR